MLSNALLCIDVGNSRTKFGLFRGGEGKEAASGLPACAASTVVEHGRALRWQKLRGDLSVRRGDTVHGFVAGSNPDGVGSVLEGWPKDWPAPTMLDDVSQFSVVIRLDQPQKAGVDRILNAVAVNRIRLAGQPAVIVDTGTATTVDAVSPDGAFEGGAILPGFELCARALNQYTAYLPYITVDELQEESSDPLGVNTRAALRSGLIWGQVGAIKELVQRLAQRWETAPDVVLTGGGAPLAAPHLPQARWEPHLSLQGLAVVAAGLVEEET
jgi:type III pantothenate kinase